MKETVRVLMGARELRLRDRAVLSWATRPSTVESEGAEAMWVAIRSDRAGALTVLMFLNIMVRLGCCLGRETGTVKRMA